MTTFIRLLKVVRRLNISPKTRTTRRNTWKNAAFHRRLLHSQALFLTNQKNEFTTVTQAQENQEISEDHRMINLFQHEIQNYGRLRKIDVDKLLEDVKESGVVSNLQGLFLLKCCSELMSNKSTTSRRMLADEIWKTLKELGVELDVSHYNALLNVYTETEHRYSPTDFLEEMVNASITPNRVTYQKLIAQYCSDGQVTEASQILNHAKSQGIAVNEDMLTSLIYGHFANNNDEIAFEILNDMEKNGTQLTIKTYSTLLYVYANRGEIDNIRKTLEECEAKGVWVPDKVLLRIIHNLCVHGFSQYVDEILALTCRGNVYLSEATKIIYKLIEKHHYKTAFKIYQTLPENRTIVGGNIFLQALINSDAPLEKSIEYCRLMEVEKLNPTAFLSAVQKSIANDMYHSSIKLLKAWKQLGGVIKAHYFSPILKAHGEAGQHEEITKVLQIMISEFELQPSIYILTNSIVPYMQCDDDEMLPILLGNHINHVRAANTVLIHLLKKNDIRKAVKLMNNFSMQYRAEIVKSSLLNAFINTEDVPSFVSVVHHLYMLKLRYENSIIDKEPIKKVINSQEFVDSFISETIDAILSKNESAAPSTINKYLIVSLFRNLIDKGISLSSAAADNIKAKLSNKMTPLIEEALTTLKSQDLVPKPLSRQLQNMGLEKKLTNIDKLERLAKILSVTNKQNAVNYQKELLYYYCSILNYDKINQVLKELKENGVLHSPATFATIIDAFLRMNKIDEAEVWLIRAKGMEDFHMSRVILLKLATAIAEAGHFKRALHCLNQPTVSSNVRSLRTCSKFLKAIMQFDDENYLLQAFDVLQENGYITALENHLFTPLVLLYLHRGNNQAALDKFQWVYKTYGLAPCQIQLMKTFIQAEDENSLNQVINISEEVDGPLACYFNLALAYLENSQVAQAKEVIEKHVPRLPESIVFEQAVYYCNNGQINNLENLFEILNDLNYDVEKICVVMLKAFGYYNEWEKGYKLWIKMKEDNIKPSNAFFDYMNLVMNTTGSANSILKEFLEAAEGSDELKNRELLDKLPLLYKSDGYSRLCKRACQKENFSDVLELCKELRNRFNLDIHSFDAEFILDIMVKNKDVASVEKMGLYMSQDLKNQIKYNFYLNRVYLISGSWNLYLKGIEKRLDEGTINWPNLNMHVRTAVESLFQHPELLEQFESLAHRCNEDNVPGPMHVLWIYYFFNDESKAQQLWSQFIKKSKLTTWLEAKNFQRTTPEMYIQLAELLKDSGIKKTTMVNIFTSFIERSLNSDHPDKYKIALQCLLHGTQKLPMESYDIDILVRLQTGLENSGIRWPWSSRMSKKEERQQVKNVVEAIMEIYK